MNGHRTGRQVRQCRDTMVVRGELNGFPGSRLDGDCGSRDSGACLIDDDQTQLSLIRRVLREGRNGREQKGGRQEQALREMHAEHYSGRARRGD